MRPESTSLSIPFELVIQHEAALSMEVVSELVRTLQDAVVRVSIRQTRHRELERFGFPEWSKDFARLLVERHSADALWLETCESGSSKFKGRIVALGLWTLSVVSGMVITDILHKNKKYDEFTTWAEKQLDEFATSLASEIELTLNPKTGEPKPEIRAEIVGDRLRIIVVPEQRRMQIGFYAPPPKR